MKLIDTDQAQRIHTLRGNAYFTDLPEPLLAEVALHMHLRKYQRSDILFWEADPSDGLHIIESGSAKIFRLSPQGRQYIVRILQEGDTFAEVPAFDGGLNPVNVEALETSRIWVINGAKLRSLVTR
jgi:CRP-like cAMP-binding protein